MARDEFDLTPKQRAFADEYIANGGNGTEAYLKSYKNVKNENTAGVSAYHALRNPKIQHYIRERTRMTLAERDLVVKDVVNHLIDLALGAEKESRSRVYNNITGELEEDITYKNSASPKVQTEAMALLLKHLGIDESNADLERKRLELANEKTKVEIEKLKSQIGGDEGQDEKIAGFISQLKDVIIDE